MDVTLLHPPFTSVLADTHHTHRHIHMNIGHIYCVSTHEMGWTHCWISQNQTLVEPLIHWHIQTNELKTLELACVTGVVISDHM